MGDPGGDREGQQDGNDFRVGELREIHPNNSDANILIMEETMGESGFACAAECAGENVAKGDFLEPPVLQASEAQRASR